MTEEPSKPEAQDVAAILATLSHDLRNPLGAITNGAAILQRLPLDERGKNIAVMIGECAAKMTELIEAALDPRKKP